MHQAIGILFKRQLLISGRVAHRPGLGPSQRLLPVNAASFKAEQEKRRREGVLANATGIRVLQSRSFNRLLPASALSRQRSRVRAPSSPAESVARDGKGALWGLLWVGWLKIVSNCGQSPHFTMRRI